MDQSQKTGGLGVNASFGLGLKTSCRGVNAAAATLTSTSRLFLERSTKTIFNQLVIINHIYAVSASPQVARSKLTTMIFGTRPGRAVRIKN